MRTVFRFKSALGNRYAMRGRHKSSSSKPSHSSSSGSSSHGGPCTNCASCCDMVGGVTIPVGGTFVILVFSTTVNIIKTGECTWHGTVTVPWYCSDAATPIPGCQTIWTFDVVCTPTGPAPTDYVFSWTVTFDVLPNTGFVTITYPTPPTTLSDQTVYAVSTAPPGTICNDVPKCGPATFTGTNPPDGEGCATAVSLTLNAISPACGITLIRVNAVCP